MTPLSPQIQLQLQGSLHSDRDFIAVREKHFKTKQNWVTVDTTSRPSLLYRELRSISRVPLYVLNSTLGWDQRVFAKQGEVTDPEWNAFLKALKTHSWDAVELNSLTLEETWSLVDQAHDLGYLASVRSFPLPVINVQGLSFASYWASQSKRHSGTFKDFTKKFKGAQKTGLEIRAESPTWEQIIELLDRRDREFVQTDDYSQSEDFRRFFRELREKLRASDRLIEASVWQGDRLVAYQTAFRNGPVLHLYQTAYDPEFRKLQPGLLATFRVIEHAFGIPEVQLINFMGYTATYARLGTHILDFKYALVFRKSLRGLLVYGIIRAKRLFIKVRNKLKAQGK